MNSLVREARLDDAAEIARIHVVGWQVAYRGILPDTLLDGLSIEQRTLDWQQRLQPSAGKNFVIEMDSVIAGWASIGPCRDSDKGADTGELYAIYLDPPRWRAGLGTRLHGHIERALISAEFREVTLWVLEANRPARAFYEKHGYRVDGAQKNALREGARLPELRYAKQLGAEV